MNDTFNTVTPYGKSKVEVFTNQTKTTNTEWGTWFKPRGVSMVNIVCIGGGGGGGAGFQGAAASARGGGGGGSSGGILRLTIAANLIPDKLWIEAGQGGIGDVGTGLQTSGDISRVVIFPTNSLELTNTIAISSNGVATFGGSGTAAAGGTGGAAASQATIGNFPLAGLGLYDSVAGHAGTNGGAQTGAIGTAQTFPTTSIVVMGGTGGGGTTSADFAGGAITAVASSFLSEQRAQPAAAGSNNGSGGFNIPKPFFSFPGMGGGSSNTGTGGTGGNGSYGSGGGGGGGGVTRGIGGDGGCGVVIITSW